MPLPKILTDRLHAVGFCDQKNGRIVIRDLAVTDWSDDRSEIWEYRHETGGNEKFGCLAGLKFRRNDYYGEDVALFCTHPSRGYIVSMKSKKVLLTAEDAGWNPHTVELLPNGTFSWDPPTTARSRSTPRGKRSPAIR